MDWLKYLGLQPAPPNPIMTNPVGTSTTQRLTNPSPTVSPVASAILDSPEQRIGRFWNLATGRGKAAYTGADMPALAASGNEAIDAGTGWATTTPIRAFHGSPHTFDRFDLSKIGTGEGAQAYGHGLYFAGNEGVAKSYRDTLSTWSPPKIQPSALKTHQPEELAKLVNSVMDEFPSASAPQIAGVVGDRYAGVIPKNLAELIRDAKQATAPTGSMYEVNLRTSPERLLDWDKPLSAQPGVVQELARSADLSHLKPGNRTRRMIEMWREGVEQPHNPATGHTFHNAVSDYGGQSNPALSEKLRAAGLDGIQYLDAGSRAAGDGSRNYVIFDDKLIDILRRYGLFGLGMTGGAMGAAQTYAPQGAEQ